MNKCDLLDNVELQTHGEFVKNTKSYIQVFRQTIRQVPGTWGNDPKIQMAINTLWEVTDIGGPHIRTLLEGKLQNALSIMGLIKNEVVTILTTVVNYSRNTGQYKKEAGAYVNDIRNMWNCLIRALIIERNLKEQDENVDRQRMISQTEFERPKSDKKRVKKLYDQWSI